MPHGPWAISRTSFPLAEVAATLKSDSPRARRAAVFSLWRQGSPEAAKAIIPATIDADPIVSHTARRALLEMKAAGPCLEFLTKEPATSPLFASVLSAARQIHDPAIVDFVIAQLKSAQDQPVREQLLSALCRLHFLEGEWKGDSWGTRPDTTGPYYQREPWPRPRRLPAC